jgi:methyl-accepting chemotaxis protein
VESATVKANDGKGISSKMIEGFSVLEEKIMSTSELISDVTNAAKEQSVGMSQISDAVGQLDQFTQQNAAIADKTNAIAQESNKIALAVVQNVNQNNFDGKGTVAAPKVHTEVPTKTAPQVAPKKAVATPTKPIKTSKPKVSETAVNTAHKEVPKTAPVNKVVAPQKDNDDEWESF